MSLASTGEAERAELSARGAGTGGQTQRSAEQLARQRGAGLIGSALAAPAPDEVHPTALEPQEVRTGAEDGSEMGVWGLLKQPQRVANLEASLDAYLRFGLEAGLLFAT